MPIQPTKRGSTGRSLAGLTEGPFTTGRTKGNRWRDPPAITEPSQILSLVLVRSFCLSHLFRHETTRFKATCFTNWATCCFYIFIFTFKCFFIQIHFRFYYCDFTLLCTQSVQWNSHLNTLVGISENPGWWAALAELGVRWLPWGHFNHQAMTCNIIVTKQNRN